MVEYEKIDREDREEWLHHPVTEAFLGKLAAEREEGAERIVQLVKDCPRELGLLQHYGGRVSVADVLLDMVHGR